MHQDKLTKAVLGIDLRMYVSLLLQRSYLGT